MRSEDPEYNITQNGKYINSTRVMRENVTALIIEAFLEGEVILDNN